MTRILLLTLWVCGLTALNAQIQLDLQYGSSKSDYQYATLAASYQTAGRWRFGAEWQHSDYRYRFIDARAVRNGYAMSARLLAVARLAEDDRIRLDAFVKPGIRLIQAPDGEEPLTSNYAFEDGLGITLDPGLLATFKARERLWLHTGVNLHMALQIRPESIFEQYPSGFLFAGASAAAGRRWTWYGNALAGPAVGAGGDTEKFYWQLALGARLSFGASLRDRLLAGY
jgi:hypothetical protein